MVSKYQASRGAAPAGWSSSARMIASGSEHRLIWISALGSTSTVVQAAASTAAAAIHGTEPRRRPSHARQPSDGGVSSRRGA